MRLRDGLAQAVSGLLIGTVADGEILRVTADGEVFARSDSGAMVKIHLAPHRLAALTAAPALGLARSPYEAIAILAAELADREQ